MSFVRNYALRGFFGGKGESGGGGSDVTIRNQNKTITENGTYKADSGYTGLGTVIVDVPETEPVLEALVVTENGEYIPGSGVDGFSPVTVNVEASGGEGQWTTDGIATKEEPNGDLTINAAMIGDYAFRGYTGITSVNAPNCTQVCAFVFYSCYNLKSIKLPVCKAIGQGCLSGSLIEILDLPSLTALGYGSIGDMTSLKTLILRNPNGVSLSHSQFAVGTCFANGGTGGTIYVPQALIDSGFYTTATNWTVVNEYGTITWKAIEGSEYE